MKKILDELYRQRQGVNALILGLMNWFLNAVHPAFTKLDEKRIQFLEQTVLNCIHNSSSLLKDHYLLEVSHRRIGWEGLNLDSATQAAAVHGLIHILFLNVYKNLCLWAKDTFFC